MNKKSVVGIDLGTSSVKVIKRYEDGSVEKAKAAYKEINPKAWWDAIGTALSQLDLSDVAAVGLSSQVGTYIIDDEYVISWNEGAGADELKEVLSDYNVDVFMEEISMPHPSIVSYPIPRLRYIKKKFPKAKKVCMPKDFICEMLTGNWVTDPYSWRGLADLEKKTYSEFFLKELGFAKEQLPQMLEHTAIAGYAKTIFPEGTPVYVGLNDYYASLFGMGIHEVGDMFDISGTSEHLGVIEDRIDMETKMVSGPYLNANVHYGVTASSGASLDFALSILENGIVDLDKMLDKKPPIFLPYLNGERAPIWDPDARGLFFGIEAGCSKEDMAYSVIEGVVFSLYHIYEHMGKPVAKTMKLSGGAAVNPVLNQLKAEMFGIPIEVLEEKDTSALGAVILAERGLGWKEADSRIKEKIEPTGRYNKWLRKRYSIYKTLYPSVKMQYEKLKEMNL